MSCDREIEQLVRSALSKLSFESASRSEVVKSSFQRFFAQREPKEYKNFFPKGWLLQNQKSSVNSSSSTKSLSNINSLVEGLLKFKPISEERYKKLWTFCGKISHVSSEDVYVQLEHISNSVTEHEEMSDLSACRARLCLLFFAHGLHELEDTLPIVNLGPGRSRATAALDEVAAHSQMDREQLANISKRKKNYFLIAEKCGLGILLMMGSSLSGWERLTSETATSTAKQIEKNHPNIQALSRSLSPVAAKLIVEGLLSFGWTYDRLSKSKTTLMFLVGKHINLGELCNGHIEFLSVPSTESDTVTHTSDSINERLCRADLDDRVTLESSYTRDCVLQSSVSRKRTSGTLKNNRCQKRPSTRELVQSSPYYSGTTGSQNDNHSDCVMSERVLAEFIPDTTIGADESDATEIGPNETEVEAASLATGSERLGSEPTGINTRNRSSDVSAFEREKPNDWLVPRIGNFDQEQESNVSGLDRNNEILSEVQPHAWDNILHEGCLEVDKGQADIYLEDSGRINPSDVGGSGDLPTAHMESFLKDSIGGELDIFYLTSSPPPSNGSVRLGMTTN